MKKYNGNMGGVDKADMLCAVHGRNRKSKSGSIGFSLGLFMASSSMHMYLIAKWRAAKRLC